MYLFIKYHILDGVRNLVKWVDMPFAGLLGKNDWSAGRGGFLQGPTPSQRTPICVESDSGFFSSPSSHETRDKYQEPLTLARSDARDPD